MTTVQHPTRVHNLPARPGHPIAGGNGAAATTTTTTTTTTTARHARRAVATPTPRTTTMASTGTPRPVRYLGRRREWRATPPPDGMLSVEELFAAEARGERL